MFLKGVCAGCGISAFIQFLIATITALPDEALVHVGMGILWALLFIGLVVYTKKN